MPGVERVTAEHPDVNFYTAALDRRIKVLVSFGGNMVMAHGDSARGREEGLAADALVTYALEYAAERPEDFEERVTGAAV